MSKMSDYIAANPILGEPISEENIARMYRASTITDWWICDEYQQRMKREAEQYKINKSK